MTRPALPASPPDNAWSRLFSDLPAAGIVTLTYDVELITPMFGGGVDAGEPDPEQPFRTRGIKGHLRWWWRLLAEAGEFDALVGGMPGLSKRTVAERREFEANLWGMADAARPRRSKVSLFVARHSLPCSSASYQIPGKNTEDARWANSAYAMFPAQAQRGRVSRKVIPAGERFTLSFNVPVGIEQTMVEATVLAWATFGGIGARTRRGVGAVAVRKNGQLLNAIGTNAIAPSIKCCGLTAVARGRFQGVALPQCAFEDARDAWIAALVRLKNFRQGEGIGRNGTRGRSCWPEPDAVRCMAGAPYWLPRHPPAHQAGNWFPRAAFGMPLTIRFMGDAARVSVGDSDQPNLEPVSRELLPHDSSHDRMASPLLLRPVAVEIAGHVRYWAIAALLERHPFRTISKLRMEAKGRPPQAVDIWNAQWSAGLPGSCGGIPALERTPQAGAPYSTPRNAVESFMNYFDEQ